jgi:hypothetical protein
MVPSTWLSVFLFFVVIAPGLLFDLLSERRRAGLSESAFREISRIALASFIFSGFAVAVLIAVHAATPSWMPDPRQLVQHGSAYVRAEYGLIARTLVIEVALAFGFSWCAHLLLSRLQGGATIRQVSAWTQVFRRDIPSGHQAYVRVRLNGGTVYCGTVANFTAGPETQGRELVLAPPLYAKAATSGSKLTPLPEIYQRVIVSGDTVEIMSVEYRMPATSVRQRRRSSRRPRRRP